MELGPYWKWPGIPPEQQPPDHYVLLGIAPFEADRDVIENAAVRQMSHVRTFQGGQHAAISQQLLNELSAVRLCLLDEEQKQVYDEQLQARLSATHSSQELPVATPQLPVTQKLPRFQRHSELLVALAAGGSVGMPESPSWPGQLSCSLWSHSWYVFLSASLFTGRRGLTIVRTENRYGFTIFP